VHRSIFDILKDKGLVYVTIPNGYGAYEITAFFARVLKLFIPSYKFSSSGPDSGTLSSSPHVRFYTYNVAMNSFIESGFTVCKYFPLMVSHISLLRMLSNNFLYIARYNFEKCLYTSPGLVDDWGFILTKKINNDNDQYNRQIMIDTLFNKVRVMLYSK